MIDSDKIERIKRIILVCTSSFFDVPMRERISLLISVVEHK